MIIKGNRHNNGAKLAAYMMTGLRKKGEEAELGELRGFGEAENILDAFRDIEVMAGATKADNALFHVQVRLPEHERLTPEQWQQTADRIEKRLGLTGQPRAVYFHVEKTGDKHMHIGFSLIDADTMTAKPLPFFKFRVKSLARQLEEEFDLTRVSNVREGPIKFAATKAQQEQDRRLGVLGNEVRNTIRACWDRSDCGRSFDDALADEALILVQGNRRDYLVMDHAGGLHALGKRILDVSAAKVRDRLADLDRENIPTIEQAREFMLDLPRDRIARLKQELEDVQKQMEADRATVSPEIEWEEALAKAAIAKEEQGRQSVGGRGREQETKARHAQIINAAKREVSGGNKNANEQGREEKERPTSGPQRREQVVSDVGRVEPKTMPDNLKGVVGDIWTAKQNSESARSFVTALTERELFVAVIREEDRASDRPRDEREELAALFSMKNNAVWLMANGGATDLTEKQRDSAERSYDNYRQQKVDAGKNPMDFSEYISFIQAMNAEKFRELQSRYPDEVFTQNKARHGAIYADVGTFVVVNQRGYLYYLNNRTTGATSAEMREFMGNLNPDQFQSVTATRKTIEERAGYKERKERDENLWPIMPPKSEFKSPEIFWRAANDAGRDKRPENLKGKAAEVWDLWTRIDYEQHTKEFDALLAKGTPFSVATNHVQFAKGLYEKGIMFGAASKEEAAQSHREAEFAKAVGNYTPRFKEGEIVIVTEQRPEYRRDDEIIVPRRVHKLDQSLAENFVQAMGGREKLQSIDATLKASDARGQQRITDRQAIRKVFADSKQDRARKIVLENGTRKTAAIAKDGVHASAAVLGRAASAASSIGKALDVVGGMFESLVAPTLTPQQIYEGEKAKDRREAEADMSIDFSQQNAEIAQERQQEQAARSRERERDR